MNRVIGPSSLAYKPSEASILVCRQKLPHVHTRAEEGFCRDKIAFPANSVGEIEGESTLVFLGAEGQQVEVQGKKVRVGESVLLDSTRQVLIVRNGCSRTRTFLILV